MYFKSCQGTRLFQRAHYVLTTLISQSLNRLLGLMYLLLTSCPALKCFTHCDLRFNWQIGINLDIKYFMHPGLVPAALDKDRRYDTTGRI